MSRVVIPKNRVNELLDNLKSEYRIAAPVLEDGVFQFKEVDSSEQVRLTDEITYKSPKEFIFPQIEKFLRFDEKGDLIQENKTEKTVIFGVKPCDLEALKVLTAVFTKGKFTDTLFVEHLKNTIIIGIGCISEKPGCFCSDRGLDKGSSKECDVFLKDMGEYYIADVLTEGGQGVIKNFLPGLDSAEDDVKTEDSTSGISQEKKLLELNSDEDTLFNKINWEEISETCMGCGTCTYICPTCHCFEFKDVADKGSVNRYRCWDSCMYPNFTMHTSGHNPRASKKERYRQRILHKYLYVKQNFGYTACTGCGRCIRSCPAGMNIKSVVKGIMEVIERD